MLTIMFLIIIILIGGTPKAGKTQVARMLQQKLSCTVFSMDEILKLFSCVYPSSPFGSGFEISERVSFSRKVLESLVRIHTDLQEIIIVEGDLIMPEDCELYKNINPTIVFHFVVYTEISEETKHIKIQAAKKHYAQDDDSFNHNIVDEGLELGREIVEKCKTHSLNYTIINSDFNRRVDLVVDSLYRLAVEAG